MIWGFTGIEKKKPKKNQRQSFYFLSPITTEIKKINIFLEFY